MPKFAFETKTTSVGAETCVLLAPHGFVDSSTSRVFERALENAAEREARFLILDLSGVHYVNSTGISLIIRFWGVFRDRDGMLVLAAVPRPVGISMHLLGVTSLVPFQKDVESAEEAVKAFLAGTFEGPGLPSTAEKESLDAAGTGRKILVPVRRRRAPVGEARVLVLAPKPTRFTRILKLRFRHLDGNFHLFHDTSEALSRLENVNPDLVVVDQRMDPDGEFVTRVKLHPDRSLISLIKIYAKDTDVGREFDFKIWENDYLVDPFEILELFSLSEAELIRVPKDRKVFHQQVRFGFKTTKRNIGKANKLCDLIIRSALEKEEDRTAMYAAVKEGIDNAVIHGNTWNEAKAVDVNFLVDRHKLTCIVEDEGKGFDFEYYLSHLDDEETFERAKRRILDEGRRGGLGILLMHRCTDRIEYAGAGNSLRLEKNLS